VQKLVIHRIGTKTLAERLWTEAEVKTLKRVFTDSPKRAIMEASTGRTWKSIERKAARMNLNRWTEAESPVKPLPMKEKREPTTATPHRKPRVAWEMLTPNPLQQLSSRGTGGR
jgi:hypothetical protein